MSSRKEHGRGIGLINQLIFLVIVVTVAVVVISFVFSSNGPFKQAAPPAPAPVTVGQIKKLYQLQTATVTGQTIIEGTTKSQLPFSETKITYQVIMTVTAGIDLSLLNDGDIQSDGDTLRIVLPAPKILSEDADFVPIAQSKGILAGPSERNDLPKLVVDEGKKRVRDTILEQGQLMRDAKTNAQDELRNLIFQIAPQYKSVIFLDSPLPSPSTSARPSVSPGTVAPPR